MEKPSESENTRDRIEALESQAFNLVKLSIEESFELKFLHKFPEYPEVAKLYGDLEKKRRNDDMTTSELSKKLEIDQLLLKTVRGKSITEDEITKLEVLKILQKK